jgi:hypothetical protein
LVLDYYASKRAIHIHPFMGVFIFRLSALIIVISGFEIPIRVIFLDYLGMNACLLEWKLEKE